jgi:hypothetical protein
MTTPVERSEDGGLEMELWEAMLLHGVLPVLLVGLILPIGLPACFLGAQGASAWEAVKHGELFLSAGNAGFTGSLVLLSSRTDIQRAAALVAVVALILFMLIPFCLWAFLTTQAILGKEYSEPFAIIGGSSYAVLAVVVALVLVRLSYRPHTA